MSSGMETSHLEFKYDLSLLNVNYDPYICYDQLNYFTGEQRLFFEIISFQSLSDDNVYETLRGNFCF